MREDQVQHAVQEAKKIRHDLLQIEPWKETDLAGACGLASILLSIELNDVSILSYTSSGVSWVGEHVWTEVDGIIIDITASQFHKRLSSKVDDVLVTKNPKTFHTPVQKVGMDVYLLVINGGWYDDGDHPEWSKISEYWLP